MGIIVFQAWKAYRSQVDEQHKLAIAKEKKECEDAMLINAFKNATSSIMRDVKQAQEKLPASSSTGSGLTPSLNEVNAKANEAKATQTTVKNIGAIAKDLNPLKK
jgi:hypothetical protein